MKGPSGTTDSQSMDKLEFGNEYFKPLYTSFNPSDANTCNLSKMSLSKLTQVHLQTLEGPITIKEIVAAIHALKTGKAPGSDRITAEFHKRFKTQLVPHIHSILVIRYLHDGQIPKSWLEVKVVLIPKPGRDLLKPEAYRPISLLNMDSKILAIL